MLYVLHVSFVLPGLNVVWCVCVVCNECAVCTANGV